MTEPDTAKTLTETRMRDAFFLLVSQQDEGKDVEHSRASVATAFAVSLADVKEIERRGLAEHWPPLI